MTRQQERVTSVGEFLSRIAESKLTKEWAAHVRIWFRGHRDEHWALEPGVYRMGLEGDEDHQLLVESHMMQDFKSFGSKLLPDQEYETKIYFIQQHYRLPTRLLDWSSNPLTALYFAVQGPDDRDGEIFLLDSYAFTGGHMTFGNMDFRRAVSSIATFSTGGWPNEWPKHIMAVRPPADDPRIIAQSGFFIFHPKGKRYLTLDENHTLRSHVIPKQAKPTIRRELDLLNLNEFTVFGGLDHLANWLKAAYTRV